MKKFILFVFAFRLITAFAQNWYPQPETLADFDLKGPVKEVIITTNCPPQDTVGLYRGMYMNVRSRYGCYLHATFNRLGLLETKSGRYDHQTEVEKVLEISYFRDSLPVEILNTEFGSLRQFLLFYEDNGSLRYVEEAYGSNQLCWVKFSYDPEKQQRVIEEKCSGYKSDFQVEKFNDEGLLIEKSRQKGKHHRPFMTTLYTYNESGKIIEKYIWDKYNRGSLAAGSYEHYWYVYTYDAQGNQTSIREYEGAEKRLLNLQRFGYDENNRLIMEKDSNAYRGNFYVDSIFYNEQGLPVSEVSYSGTDIWRMIDYTYDAAGNLLSRISLQAKYESFFLVKKDELNKWKLNESQHYTYDSRGNWTQCIQTYSWKEETDTITRAITYYE